MKGNRKYVVVLALCFIALVLINVFSPKPIDWSPSYTSKSKTPYGTAALYSALPELFPGQAIRDVSMPVYNTLNDAAQGNYIVINDKFQADSLDLRVLLSFVKKGNTAFIAANSFEGAFADSLKLETAVFFAYGQQKIDSAALNELYFGHKGAEAINFTNPQLHSANAYTYTNCFNSVFLSVFDTLKATVLGKSEAGQVDFISMKMGKGTLYISTVPEAFCNYHFVKERNDEYVVKALSYLPDAPLLWDEYYKAGNRHDEDSSLRVIFRHPAMAMAYYVLIFSLLIFMIIGVKRRQRIIPVIEPMKNTTLQFVDVVGALYYQTGDHKNIAEKKITYFLEYIRNAFQVHTTLFDEAFFSRVISVSGIEKEKIHTLFNYIAEMRFRQIITQEDLIKLNKLIEEFYTLNKR